MQGDRDTSADTLPQCRVTGTSGELFCHWWEKRRRRRAATKRAQVGKEESTRTPRQRSEDGRRAASGTDSTVPRRRVHVLTPSAFEYKPI